MCFHSGCGKDELLSTISLVGIFALWDKEGNCGTFAAGLRYLYSAGRPSRWASVHILVGI